MLNNISDRTNFLNNLASKQIDYNLGAGVPPLNLYPVLNPGTLFGEEKIHFNSKFINYHETQGFITKEASVFFEKNENVQIDSNNILITNGVQEAISLAISCFKEKTVACIEPSYPGFEDAAKTFGCKTIKFQESSWLKELENLPSGSLFNLSADFSNPTGYSLNFEERKRLIDLAAEKNFYIFDDATYRPFNLAEPLPSLISMYSDKVIHAMSFSKILAPGLRTGFIAIPSTLISEFISAKANLSLNNSGITQKIVSNWLEINDYNLSNHLSRVKERLKRNQEILNIHGIDFNGGFFCTLKSNKSINYEFCERLLLNEQIGVIPMMLFSDNPIYQNQMRICVANIEDQDLGKVIQKIKDFEA
jgi:GntR family transcriptional regulator, regulator for abcA and norABC